MARLKGLLKMQGSAGNMTFAKTQDGVIVKEKSGVSGERIATDPKFARTRENMREFGRAGKAALVLLAALRPYVHRASDGRVFARLSAMMMKVVKSDTVNNRGDRNITDGNNQLIRGFELNIKSKLQTLLYAPRTVSIDREAGELEVTFAPFVPDDSISIPDGATHFRIVAAAVEVDFDSEETIASDVANSNYLTPGVVATTELTLTCNLTPDSVKPYFLVLGIQFFEQCNGQYYAFNNEKQNAFKIVKLDM